MARDEKTVLLQMIGNQAIQIAQQQVTIEAQQSMIEAQVAELERHRSSAEPSDPERN